jgi:hypothetical protein
MNKYSRATKTKPRSATKREVTRKRKVHPRLEVLPEEPMFVVALYGRRSYFLSYSEAFAEAVELAQEHPGKEVELWDPENGAIMGIHIQPDGGLRAGQK